MVILLVSSQYGSLGPSVHEAVNFLTATPDSKKQRNWGARITSLHHSSFANIRSLRDIRVSVHVTRRGS